MKIRKIATLALSVVMLSAMLSGCVFGGKTVMKVNGSDVSEQVFLGAVGQMNSMYKQNLGMTVSDLLDQDFGEGMTGADLIKDSAVNYLLSFEAIRSFAKENNIKLDGESRAALKAEQAKIIEAYGGRKAYLDALAQENVTEEFADYFNETMAINEKVCLELFMGDGPFAITTDEMAETLSSDYARVKHVLVQAQDPNADDYAEKRKKAEEIAAKAKAGADFDALIEEFGDDPGMESNPNGYIFDKNGYDLAQSGQMVIEFTNAAHELAENGVSGVVKTSHGFHIIKRLPLTKEYVEENVDDISPMFAQKAVYAKVEELVEKAEVEKTKAYDEVDLYSFFGVQKADAPLAPEVSDDAAQSGDEAPSAEGGIESVETVDQHDGHDH